MEYTGEPFSSYAFRRRSDDPVVCEKDALDGVGEGRQKNALCPSHGNDGDPNRPAFEQHGRFDSNVANYLSQ